MSTSPVAFLKETQDELKKVTWPRQSDIIRLTFVVIVVSLLVGFIIGGLDYALTKLTEIIIK